MENLILTGYGWTDYAVAAAVALPTVVGRTFDVDAEPFLPYAAEGGRVSARVREGKFRGDLYQRLNVVQLRIPALREHKDDIRDIRDIADGWWLNHHRRHLTDE